MSSEPRGWAVTLLKAPSPGRSSQQLRGCPEAGGRRGDGAGKHREEEAPPCPLGVKQWGPQRLQLVWEGAAGTGEGVAVGKGRQLQVGVWVCGVRPGKGTCRGASVTGSRSEALLPCREQN